MNTPTVRARVLESCETLRRRDSVLLKYDANERTIAAKLAEYLGSVFPDYSVDLEYNRHCGEVKRVPLVSNSVVFSESLVLPDIVVHRRGDDCFNLIVCEVKKTSATISELSRDRIKLKSIKKEFTYDHALLIVIPVASRCTEDFQIESVD